MEQHLQVYDTMPYAIFIWWHVCVCVELLQASAQQVASHSWAAMAQAAAQQQPLSRRTP